MGGLLFGDAYAIPSHHLEDGQSAVGLVLRRGYLTFDADITQRTFGRLRFELNQSGEFETYTFDADVKDLYLGWNLGRHQLIAGLTSTITYDLIESVWGYRHLARTPLDLQGVPSRDNGLSIKGPLNQADTLRYRFMLGSRVDLGAETTEATKVMGALTWKPYPRWTIDLYADYQENSQQVSGYSYQAFAAYQAEDWRWGAQYAKQDLDESPPIELISAFIIKSLSAKTELVTRVDRLLEPSPKGNDIAYLPVDPSAKATLFFAGVTVELSPHVSLIPNTVITAYDRNDQGMRPETDVYLRMTLFNNYE